MLHKKKFLLGLALASGLVVVGCSPSQTPAQAVQACLKSNSSLSWTAAAAPNAFVNGDGNIFMGVRFNLKTASPAFDSGVLDLRIDATNIIAAQNFASYTVIAISKNGRERISRDMTPAEQKLLDPAVKCVQTIPPAALALIANRADPPKAPDAPEPKA